MAWAVRALLNQDRDSIEFGVLQWVDTAAAQAWLREIAYQIGRPDPSTLTDPSAMRTRCMDLARAVGQFCRALDLPMPIVKPYREAIYHRHWTEWGSDGVTVGAWLDDSMRALRENGGGFIGEHFGESGSAEYAHAVTSAVYESRVGLTLDGHARDGWWNAQASNEGGEWLSLFNDSWPNAYWSGWWVRWNNGKAEFLVPFSEAWAILYGTGAELVRRGVDGTLMDAQETVVEANLDVFRHLPSEVLGRYGIESAADLEAVIPQMHEAHAVGHYAATTGFRVAIGAAAAVLGPLTGGLGSALLGIYEGLIEVLFAFLPASTQRLDDSWGRPMPVFEQGSIESSGISDTPPSFAIEPAPVRYYVAGTAVPYVPPLLPSRPATGGTTKKKKRRFRSYPRRPRA